MSEDPLLILFPEGPRAGELPARFPSPFAASPHPLAVRAAHHLIADLTAERLEGLGGAAAEGKMLAVLVVRAPSGALGYLRGFSGMLGGRWRQPGFVPPIFDEQAREPWWSEAQRELAGYERELRELREGTEVAARRLAWQQLVAAQVRELDELAASHRARRARRQAERQRLGTSAEDSRRRHLLDQESRADKAQRRALDSAHARAQSLLGPALEALDLRLAQLERRRAERSATFQQRLFEQTTVPDARGRERSLRALFSPGEPPSGAGDCAGPKLLGYALRHGFTPLAMAELWWGAAPLGGGRHHGELYPACRSKCGPLLPAMLEGLAAEPAPLFGSVSLARRQAEPALPVRFEDEWLVVVDKPAGLLSVPGRAEELAESVLVRLRRERGTRELFLAHRLDLDTSGLLLAAKGQEAYVRLQRLFAQRRIDKRYLAWVCGAPVGDAGTIELALRPDLEDRPRQLHDPVHGKPAVTGWRALEHRGGRTLVELCPLTGRTHQLRVHAAHPRGLDAPICGDRLYGRAGGEAPRLLLHAAELAFEHPFTGRPLRSTSPAPF